VALPDQIRENGEREQRTFVLGNGENLIPAKIFIVNMSISLSHVIRIRIALQSSSLPDD
jgi:hypothetical protein